MVPPAAASSTPIPARGFESLPARPPTPPRENQNETHPKQLHACPPLNARISLHTPPGYSPDSSASTTRGSRRSRKKVEFTVQAEYVDAPDKENVPKQFTPVSAPSSRDSSRPIKSILKPSSSPNPPNPLDPSSDSDGKTRYASLATMLESTIQQLAGADRDPKIDAYTMLSRALTASNNLPDRIALHGKMGLLLQFIQRDVAAKGANGGIDSSLVKHALTLLVTFLVHKGFAALPTDSGIFIIDHCIRSFEDPSIPKDVVRHLMKVVAVQDFPPRVMTADRVGRLVASLHNMEKHITGKSIIMSRIFIYQNLIRQSPLHMIKHADWLLDLFTDMLSSMKEIRSTAVTLGLAASFTFGKEKQLTRKANDVLQMTADETKYIDYYLNRLNVMADEKQSMAAVPQIWSVVTLLLGFSIDRWDHYEPWVKLLQKCFNSGDIQTKVEANYAWNRLVYSFHLTEPCFSKHIHRLCQPYLGQLKRRVGKQEELRKAVLGGVCNLYYYAFKPTSAPAQIDSYWDACARPLFKVLAAQEPDSKSGKFSVPASDSLAQASLILNGLVDSSTSRIWKEDRIVENPLARPDELPALDPKWIRRNATRVFEVVGAILRKKILDLVNPESPHFRLWQSLVGAVATAASKEVKVSADTAAFVGQALSLLQVLWSQGLDSATAESNNDSGVGFVKAIQTYLTTLVDSLGVLPFTEKLLTTNKQNILVPVATPSHRSGKTQGLTKSPVHHLFLILSVPPKGIPDGGEISTLIRTVLDPFVRNRPTRARKELVQELAQMLPSDGPSSHGAWAFVSEEFTSSLENSQSSHLSADSGSQPPIGHEYREMVRHLERGVKCTPNLLWTAWSPLYESLVIRTTEETGEAGCSIVLVEPLAKTVSESLDLAADRSVPLNALHSGVKLLSTAKQPRDRQALDAARRRLWGTSIAGSRSASFDPFDHLYRLTNRLLEAAYANLGNSTYEELVVALLTETASFLSRCSQVLVFRSLVQLERGIGLWIEDAKSRYTSKSSPKVSSAVKFLWDRICNLFVDASSLEHFELAAIEPLLCSAFQSKHRHIVSSVAELWNRAFEHAEEVQYPETLKAVLLGLEPYVDLILPGLDISGARMHAESPSFIESQEDMEGVKPTSTKLPRRSSPKARKHRSDITPSLPRSRSARRSGTPKLRHDDSQIHYAPIPSSSPIHLALESQVLTDRQMEVRERQQENAALFPGMRSSSVRTRSKSQSYQLSPDLAVSGRMPRDESVATPEDNKGHEKYVSMTPTPRRGQASMVDDDQEMTDDIPSSPFEPRRNLLPEMKSQSRSSERLEQEYPVSSSPISGSPTPKEQFPVSVGRTNVEVEEHVPGAHLPTGTVARDFEAGSLVHSICPESARVPAAAIHQRAPRRATTPPNTQLLVPQETPKSDAEVFVDARTSPEPQSPRALRSRTAKAAGGRLISATVPPSKERSFELSDDEERSMARLVIELDSRKCEPLPSHNSASPEKTVAAASHMLECITVGSRREGVPSSESNSQSSSALPSSAVETDGSQSSKRSRRKRKRATEKAQVGSTKKRRHSNNAMAKDAESVAESQAAPFGSEPPSRAAEGVTSEMDVTMEGDEGRADDDAAPNSPHDLMDQETVHDGEQRELHDGDEDDQAEGDFEAVHLQLMSEASQQSDADQTTVKATGQDLMSSGESESSLEQEEEDSDEAEVDNGKSPTAPAGPVEDEAAALEQSAFERVMSSLGEGLAGLKTAALSREEVHRVEDMFFDIKRELYQAEVRGRQ
ncbi:Rap1-interacting factor 1 N terminal-domain-containing protein [Xylariomycetidae sp. FL0641]|nr:Rap1-interacting factor 1 N terminal-domain-containing protein [Xylariomycetidae sp. FL0641]